MELQYLKSNYAADKLRKDQKQASIRRALATPCNSRTRLTSVAVLKKNLHRSLKRLVHLSCEAATSPDQLKTLPGDYTFSYRLTKQAIDFFKLKKNPIKSGGPCKGQYYLIGTNEYGNQIIATYITSLQQYALLNPGNSLDQLFVFNVCGDSTRGAYCQFIDGTIASKLYSFSGLRHHSFRSRPKTASQSCKVYDLALAR